MNLPRSSRWVLALFGGTAVIAMSIWHEYVSFRWQDADPLLAFCWIALVGLAAWRVDVRRDLPLAVAAFAGGALIESWGTRSGLWTYFTHEQPPLFILPAWPFAALATERVAFLLAPRAHVTAMLAPDARVTSMLETDARMASRLVPHARVGSTRSEWLALVTAWLIFLAILLPWARSGMSHPLTWIALGCVAITMISSREPRRDLVGFLAGSLVGIPLEYWGTTRACWTYWDGRTPPLAAVLSHGFATVAFARAAGWIAKLPREGLSRNPPADSGTKSG